MKSEIVNDKEDPLLALLKEIEGERSFGEEEALLQGRSDSFFASFLTQMIPAIKSSLGSIRNFTLIPADRFHDFDLIRTYQRKVNSNIKEIDSALNTLLNFININTPMVKGDTVNSILKQVLEANEPQITSRHFKISKKCESHLPETLIYDEQVKFILNSTLQYAILSTPMGGSIDFILRTSDPQKVGIDTKTLSEGNGGFIEVTVSFGKNHEKTAGQIDASKISSVQSEATVDLLLHLVRETLEKNRGMITRRVDKQSLRTTIILRFPIERRKVVYYDPIVL
jgi:hypothetical protein